MRKRLILLECLLAGALILCINLSKGFYPFEKLSVDDIDKIVITLGEDTYYLTADNASPVIEKLNDLRAIQKFIHGSELKSTITLHSTDETEYSLQIYENHIALNDSVYWCDQQYLSELTEIIEINI